MRLWPKLKTPKKSVGPNRVGKTSYYRGVQPDERTKSPFEKKIPRKSRVKRLTKLIDYLVVIVIGVCILYSLMVRDQPRVLSNSWAYHKASIYQTFAAKQMSALKDRSKLTFDEQSLILAITKQFPEVSSAAVELPILGQTATVRLNVARPAFIYSAGGVGYVLSAKGVIVGTSDSVATAKGLITLMDQSNIPVVQGTRVISSTSVEFIDQIIAQTKKAGVPVANIVLPAASQEIQLRTTDKPYFVKFHFSNDVLIQTGQFLAARHQFEQTGAGPNEYLDVRVPGKIFFK